MIAAPQALPFPSDRATWVGRVELEGLRVEFSSSRARVLDSLPGPPGQEPGLRITNPELLSKSNHAVYYIMVLC
jgi:hypothetical protein